MHRASQLDKAAFLSAFNFTNDDFERSRLDWAILLAIYADYLPRQRDLLTAGNTIAEILRPLPWVHSVKLRTKDPGKLIAKIIRKQLDHIENPGQQPSPYADCTPETYRSRITDLVGIRALHLFKEYWPPIHAFIEKTWKPREAPTAYIRRGDETALFEEVRCGTKEHKHSYRSVHYLIETSPTADVTIVELQVRTIFEEAWAEIDHNVRYPHQSDDQTLARLLKTFSLVAGFADELGSHTNALSLLLREQTAKIAAARADLQKALAESGLKQEQIARLQEKVENLERARARPVSAPPGRPATRARADALVPYGFAAVLGFDEAKIHSDLMTVAQDQADIIAKLHAELEDKEDKPVSDRAIFASPEELDRQ